MDKIPRQINVLVFDDVNLLDIAGPIQAFKATKINNRTAYELRYFCIPSACQQLCDGRYIVTSSCGLELTTQNTTAIPGKRADLLIPGGRGVNALLNNPTMQRLLQSWNRNHPQARLLSICSGALLLADAGVLDNKLATTHWERELEVLKRFPNVNWKLDRIFTQDGPLYTSAGVTTGIDLALNIIKQDCGSLSALSVARELVVFLKRSGGQSQFAQMIEWQFASDDSISNLVRLFTEQPNRQWTLELMANETATSPRTLTRKFRTRFNSSPVKFLEQCRVRLASDMLSTGVPIEKTATLCGFGDIQTLRRAYKRQLNTTLGEFLSNFANPEN